MQDFIDLPIAGKTNHRRRVKLSTLQREVGCPWAGEEIREDGRAKTSPCQSCGGKKLKVFPCTHPAREPEEVTAADCLTCNYRPRKPENPRRLLLLNNLSPGDDVVLTAAVYSLHQKYPGQFATAIDSPYPAVWEHNPDVDTDRTGCEPIEMHYPAINQCGSRAIHFMQAYCEYLEDKLGVRFPLATNRPRIYLSMRERTWTSQVEEILGWRSQYWIVNAGVKDDYTTKQYPYYQEVVDRLQGKVLFVQVGKTEHLHRPLKGVLNLIGKTDDRQLIRLVCHSSGVLSGLSYLMHLAAGLERPAVILGGGREPRTWNCYPRQVLLGTVGMLPCCQGEGCWKSRVVKLNDGSVQNASLCVNPTFTEPPSPKCMAMIDPEEVAANVLRFRENQ